MELELVLTRLLGCGEPLSSLDFVLAPRFLGGIVANLGGCGGFEGWRNGCWTRRRVGGGAERVLHHAKSCVPRSPEYERHAQNHAETPTNRLDIPANHRDCCFRREIEFPKEAT